MRKIILIEPYLEGHHEFYLLSFIKTCILLKLDVVLLSKPDNNKRIEQLMSEYTFLSEIEIHYSKYKELIPLEGEGIWKKIAVIRNLFISIFNLLAIKGIIKKDLEKEHIFFCCIDPFLNDLFPRFIFDAVLPFNWDALTFLSNYRKRNNHLDKRNVFHSKHCKRLYCLGEPDSSFKDNFSEKITLFPDFANDEDPDKDHPLIKEILSNAKGRTIVSLLGAIAARKGILNFVRCMKYLDPEQYYFVIAGENLLSKNETKEVLKETSALKNCTLALQRIPSERIFNGLIDVSDILYAAYINFPNSSNLLAKTCIFRKKLIVSQGGYMEKVILDYHLGLSIDENSPVDASNAIQVLKQNDLQTADYSTYLNFNSNKGLEKIFSVYVDQEV